MAKDADQDADRTDNLLNYENIDENVVIKGLTKLDKIYKKAVDGKVPYYFIYLFGYFLFCRCALAFSREITCFLGERG